MNTDCLEFRRLLERSLEGRVPLARTLEGGSELARLGWHEHLLGCRPCRDLLEAEEALEELLATLPDPKLPDRLARRVVRRLRVAEVEAGERDGSERRLDELLALDREEAVPEGLAQRVLAGLGDAQERGLDRLLEASGDVAVPVGLEQRVLRGVAARRGVEAPTGAEVPIVPMGRADTRPRLVPVFALRAAAAILLAAGATWAVWRTARPATPVQRGSGEVAQAQPAQLDATNRPDDGLLDALAILENFDLIESIDPIALDAVTVFEPEDELWLDLSEDG